MLVDNPERPAWSCMHVPGHARPQHQRRGRLVVWCLRHDDEVVLSHGPDQLPDPVTGLLDHLTKAVGSLHGATEVLRPLVGPVAEGDIDGHGSLLLLLGACCSKSDAILLPRRPNRTSCLVSAYWAESTALTPVRQGAERLEPDASAAGVLTAESARWPPRT